jgi:hypothetical protein
MAQQYLQARVRESLHQVRVAAVGLVVQLLSLFQLLQFPVQWRLQQAPVLILSGHFVLLLQGVLGQ